MQSGRTIPVVAVLRLILARARSAARSEGYFRAVGVEPATFVVVAAAVGNYGDCLSAAGDKAESVYSAFADVKMMQFNSS
jgi:hypothetical protein